MNCSTNTSSTKKAFLFAILLFNDVVLQEEYEYTAIESIPERRLLQFFRLCLSQSDPKK